MSQNAKTYFLLLCLAVLSIASIGQELDSLKTSKKALDRLEIQTSLSLLENQDFNSIPGGGLQVAVVAPFYNGGLRLGLGVGFSRLSFNYNFDWGHHRVLGPTPAYSSQMDIYPFSLDLTLGTDFLRNSSMDLILDIGARMNLPMYGNYHFDYSFNNYPTDHSFEIQPSVHPAVLASLTFSFPLNEKSSLTFGYGFSYTFLPFRPKANSESNGFHYRPEEVPDHYDNNFEDNILSPLSNGGFEYFQMLVLELPAEIGGQHSFSIGYRHTFGLGNKKE
ncbi:MAG: hypothetical protein H6603_08430 [Flavobacteriales bacterium]|nr:hypothetical protein [Flavobacteriales bacterium]MCB9191967.1 hypothetical protein [Flavobacteriales bacterium]MCB9204987.1 hypothetical protein [Flavobacteriales bacterium]